VFRLDPKWITCYPRAVVVLWLCLMWLGAFAQVPVSKPNTPNSSSTRSAKPLPKSPPQTITIARPSNKDTLRRDSTTIDSLRADTIRKDSLRKQSDLKSPVKYVAQDSLVIDMEAEELRLYGKAKMNYEDIQLDSDHMTLNWTSLTLNAYGGTDSTGNPKDEPIFRERGDEFKTEKLTYNFKTKRGKIIYGRTKQREDYVIGEAIRRNEDESLFIRNGVFTTCDHPHPHFYLRANKLKLQPGKWVVTGPVGLVVLDIPLPIGLPFAYFPLKTGRKSGIIFPVFGESAQRGFFFRDIGFYFGISDRFDLILKGDIFTNGSFRVEVNPRYALRYKYSGDLNAQFSYQALNQPGDPDYQAVTNFQVRWTHNQPLSPTARLTASVNIASPNFFVNNSYNVNQFQTNKIASSIALNKTFGRGQWTFAFNFNMDQDLINRTFNLTLPGINLTRARWQPFVRKKPLGLPKWYEQIGLNYSMNFLNRVSGKEQDIFNKNILNKLQFGMVQNISISAPFKVLKYLNVTPSFNYNEYWYAKREEKQYIGRFSRDSGSRFDSSRVNEEYGFFAIRDFNLALTIQTNIYSVAQLPGRRQVGLKLTSRPSLSYNYRPDFSRAFWGYFQNVQRDSIGNRELFNRYNKGILGSPGGGEQQRLGFVFDNVLEARWLRKDKLTDTTAKRKDRFRKVNLLDNFGLSTGFNFAAKEFNWEPVSLNARTSILGFISLNFNAILDPYKAVKNTNENGTVFWTRANRLSISAGGPLFRLTSANFNASFSLDSKKLFEGKKPQAWIRRRKEANIGEGYEPFRMPWTAAISYSVLYNNPGEQLTDGKLNHSVTFSGQIEVTQYWRLSVRSGYDITNKQFSFTQFSIMRDLHCWTMGVEFTPFGQRQSYFFTLQAKAPSLRDIKIQQRRDWQDR
jgi:hypothetical protein